MLRSAILRRAALLASVVSSMVVPLAMFIAYAPDANDATRGFRQAESIASAVLLWVGVGLAVFATTFVLAAVAMSSKSNRTTDP